MVKLLIFLKRFLTAFFIILFKPIRVILRFIFYKIIVKGYCFYISLIKKIGWQDFGSSFLSLLTNKKLVHILVTGMILIFIFFNLATKTKAGVISAKAQNTIMASLVESEFGSLGEEELIEEFIDEGVATAPVQQTYLDSLTTIKGQPQAIMKSPDEFEPAEDIASVTQEGSAIIKPEMAATKKSVKPRSKTVYYTVKPGDSVSTIAEEFAVSVSTVLWENNLSAYSLIRPGQSLAILPTTGVTHKVVRGENLGAIAKKYGIGEAKILEANNLAAANKLAVSQKLIIPGGRKITYTVRAATSYTGLSAIRDLIVPPGAKPATANKMNWPTVGHKITQYYSWRHHAVDIANKTGTPIYAADAGIVESTTWKAGYGYTITINHGGGKKTLYAHLSKFYVEKGQRVGKGDSIGAMGSSGWSTGSHLHFEVIINGRKYNPLNYIR